MTQNQIPNPYSNNPTAPGTTPNVTPGPITGASPSVNYLYYPWAAQIGAK